MPAPSPQSRNSLIYVITDGCGNYGVAVCRADALSDALSILQEGNAFRLRHVHSRMVSKDIAIQAEKMISEMLSGKKARKGNSGMWYRDKADNIVATVDLCADRAMEMDDAIEDLIEMRRKKPDPKFSSGIRDVMDEDIERKGMTSGWASKCFQGTLRK